MKQLNRIRILITAAMIFGSFANFAQNAWGLTLVMLCQFALAMSFFSEMLLILINRIRLQQVKNFNILLLSLSILLLLCMFINNFKLTICAYAIVLVLQYVDLIISLKRKKRQQEYIPDVFENYALFLSFACLGLLQLRLEGTGFLTVFTSILLFVPFYLTQAIKKKTDSELNGIGKFILTIIYLSVCIVGLSALFKTMHYPGANMMIVIGLIINALVIILLLTIPKRKKNGRPINLLQFLKIPNSHVIFLFIIMTIRLTHIFFSMRGIAPGFYENRFPQVITDLRNSGKEEDAEKSEEIAEAYNNFIEHCQNKNNVP